MVWSIVYACPKNITMKNVTSYYDQKYYYLLSMCFVSQTQRWPEQSLTPAGYPVGQGLSKCKIFFG